MTFLPIVDRELRTSSRRHTTYWSRVIAAGVMLMLFGLMVSLFLMENGSGLNAGYIQFNILKWAAFAMVTLSGVFLTADSLSEEKREGTLGLLFLTDLKGYDIVLGKLMSHSLQAFYGLLAMMPILALPMLSGGVTGVEFWHTILVMCNTLFLSLAIGMFISCISREVLKSMNGAFFLVLLFAGGLPWLDFALAGFNESKFKPVTCIASPGWLFAVTAGIKSREFWQALGIQHGIAWFFLVVTCVLVPRCWHDKAVKQKGFYAGLRRNLSFGSVTTRLRRRRKLLPLNPVLWLASRELWLTRGIWAIISLCATIIVYYAWWCIHFHVYIWKLQNNTVLSNCVMPIQVVLNVALALWVTSQACRFFVESMRNGAMELMLVTPLTPEQIVSGQRRAIVRAFWFCMVFVLVLQAVSGLPAIANAKTIILGTAKGTTAMNTSYYHYSIASYAFGLVNTLLRIGALAFCGMWMGMTSKKVTTAVLKTVCFVCVIPWFVEAFGQGLFSVIITRMNFKTSGGFAFSFWTMLFMSVIELIKNVLFIWLSPVMLRRNFRARAANRGIAATGGFTAPPVPPAVRLKPV